MLEHLRHSQTQYTIMILGAILIANVWVANDDWLLSIIWMIFALLLLIFYTIDSGRELNDIKRRLKYEEHLLRKLKGGKKK